MTVTNLTISHLLRIPLGRSPNIDYQEAAKYWRTVRNPPDNLSVPPPRPTTSTLESQMALSKL